MDIVLPVDLLLTVLFSVVSVGAGAATLWLLPWSDADRAGTSRALGQVARWAGEVAGRPRGSFRGAAGHAAGGAARHARALPSAR
jgi:hypothetical protein